MALMMSLSSTICRRTLCTSTIGDSPVTVIVSVSAPTRRSALMVAVNDPSRATPSRLTVVNPGSVNVTRVRRRPADRRCGTGRCRRWSARPHLFDQRRAGRLYGDAGQHGAGRIPNGSGDGRLGEGDRGGNCEEQRNDETGRARCAQSAPPKSW